MVNRRDLEKFWRGTDRNRRKRSSLGCSPWGQAGVVDSLGAKTRSGAADKRRANNLMKYVCRLS